MNANTGEVFHGKEKIEEAIMAQARSRQPNPFIIFEMGETILVHNYEFVLTHVISPGRIELHLKKTFKPTVKDEKRLGEKRNLAAEGSVPLPDERALLQKEVDRLKAELGVLQAQYGAAQAKPYAPEASA
jgi:uncharacterized small protein (DUF1192 family)